MIYDVKHVTAYAYETPVTFARCTLRLTPPSNADQTVIGTEIEIEPTPATKSERRCFFNNVVTTLTIEQPHEEAIFTMRARIDVHRPPLAAASSSETLDAVRAMAANVGGVDASSPAHYLFPSDRTPRYAPAVDYARASFPTGRTALDGALDVMRRIRADFKYDPDSTKVWTPLSQAFEQRSGVCQDFAHIMIAGLRGLGLPAAYVSGYLRTLPPPGKPRLEGADATHAWVNVWCGPRIGWIGLDPTNAIPAGNDHIVLATGRDYADVAPVDGILFGAREQEVRVSVDVTEAA